jgi:hypothetical protein
MHSIQIPGKLELNLMMHGVVLNLQTCQPITDEIERYQSGLLQSVELTENVPWEPYSTKFTDTETAAQATHSVQALRVMIPRPKAKLVSKETEADYPQRSPVLNN